LYLNKHGLKPKRLKKGTITHIYKRQSIAMTDNFRKVVQG